MTHNIQKSTLPTTRRNLLAGAGGITAAVGLIGSALAADAQISAPRPTSITVKDGTKIFYKDWGTGQPVVFSHGWPLTADAWDAQMLFLGQNGYRVIAHGRRGHGRSDQTWSGNDMDTYADDLAALIESLGLKDAMLERDVVRLNRILSGSCSFCIPQA